MHEEPEEGDSGEEEDEGQDEGGGHWGKISKAQVCDLRYHFGVPAQLVIGEAMRRTYFWSAFEEVGDDFTADNTRREARAYGHADQGSSSVCGPTLTMTEEREEDDQDQGTAGLAAFPRVASTQTQTMTRMQEEPDQDPIRGGLSILPRLQQASTPMRMEIERPDLNQDNAVRQPALLQGTGEVNV